MSTDNIILGNTKKTVGDPSPLYSSLAPTYKRNRAALSGERYVKQLDKTVSANNLLIPFSPGMMQSQYDWYKAEAEYPGIVEQYARTLIGGLLRKPPLIELPEDGGIPDLEEAMDWLTNNFSQQNGSLVSFLDGALWEEMNTSRAWICVNYPVTNPDDFTPEELQPFPILLSGESIINWSIGVNPVTNRQEITRLVVRMFANRQSEINEFHDDSIDTVWVHQLDDGGYYEIIMYEVSKEESSQTEVIAGKIQQNYPQNSADRWVEVDRETNILRQGDRLDHIPIFPLNGSFEPTDPMLTNLINREIALYNKTSRRNHLLYGSASFTPWISDSSLSDEDKKEIVSQGLGSWMFLGDTGSVGVLETPTAALSDLDRAIEANINEMARLGIRILSPEGSGQSGVALEIRNSAQTAQLATLNMRVSETMKSIIATMLNWRYGTELTPSQIGFRLSSDFNPAPIGADWVRIVTEWYQGGLISQDAFIETAKINDLLPQDYNIEDAQRSIEADPLVVSTRERFDMTSTPTEEE